MGISEVEQCICHEMEQLLEEQQKLSFEGFRFICEDIGFDTIPFILSNGKCPFETFGVTRYGDFFTTQVFRLENIDSKHCCATLSLLIPVDMDGCPVDLCDDVYSLIKTDNCTIVDLSCFCTIQPLSPKLVNRELPIIEPKC
ncbi:spore coat protein [Neobacillus sp. MM2021_6]|uniref:CotY/CotZ family spore coat protein n=1 Tax=Bacillaceae TaxID=186817 RepID=UPI00140CBEF4|nr:MULTISPECIES: CotY/CotZ family spore coat protein [Bacillaceae]MBO0960406.1 spore coat protein [Neobacillus sp. MM2021_6]NHC16737.1 spore coat protein [Bacillus sp. MM2020_4]WML38871.1 CotY/CotZ family spore coat protein [Neobacillus sp. OS1-2]